MEGFGGTDSWCSPCEVRDGLYDLYDGPPYTDPCTNENSIIEATIKYTELGTFRPWLKTGYENPPYSNAAIFTTHGLNEIHDRRLKEHVRLVMCSPSTVWWQEMCGTKPVTKEVAKRRHRWYYADGTTGFGKQPPNPEIIITERLKFIGDKGFNARFDTALVYYGHRPRAFHKAFAHIARWATRGRV